MATLEDLFMVQKQIDSTSKKLDAQKQKRNDLIKALGFKTPGWGQTRGENFVSINGKLHRLWIDNWGEYELEAIEV